MLIVDRTSVYEIDEECLKKRKVSEECEVYQKLIKEDKRKENRDHTKKS